MGETKFLAIVGCGARGLHALERFFITLSDRVSSQLVENYKVVLFETRENLGTGLAWDPDQTSVNWSNISDRALEPFAGRPAFNLKDVHFPSFPSYLEWLEEVMGVTINDEKDSFSKRKVTGAYLIQRAQSIVEPLQSLGLLEVKRERVVKLTHQENVFTLDTKQGNAYHFKKVLLALGHLKTTISKENQRFIEHAKKDALHFSNDPYSNEAAAIYASSKKILVKGLGLAMIDVVRMITEDDNAGFEKNDHNIFLNYTGNKNVQIVPYSLDGLAMVPKPVGKHIDDNFDPIKAGKAEMLDQLKTDIKNGEVQDVDDILYPIAGVVMNVYNRFDQPYGRSSLSDPEGKDLIVKWLKDQTTKNEHIIDTDMFIVDYMKLTCQMSHGNTPFSLDYTIGQVWRELQIDMYYLYTYQLLPPALVARFIEINEMAKRYSFGPPVESILQLIALHDARVLNLDFVNQPEIELVDEGFKIRKNDKEIVCDALIDSVLDKPNLSKIIDPLIESLVSKSMTQQFEENLGITVSESANHLLGSVTIEGLHHVGRNTKGSEHGVDALLECFDTQKMQVVIDEILLD
ncbi:hypothetical protein AAU57_08385 [Nonlabens sp. YIK11]|uniref:FAD/NAD(P)-binding protein n=1 Tax=Nonlabens sp. YIK11 TaxID=1453349 RepID=UPI0006DCB008|nr:FAD/NAD(P)-binding protein [Nonlabens sp. YIK11]KQC33329.1 hypothetical protein AAU57_08385 [Nonlabens sp. YIK11]